MKHLLLTLLCLPMIALAQVEPPPVEPLTEQPDDDLPINWVDSSHAYATDSAQALTEWMDEFFGDPNYDIERAESFLRLEFINDWDEEDGNDFKIRLRGKVQLPKISQRAHLVFSGEESDDFATEEERADEDQIGLNLNLSEGSRSRIDFTINYSSSHFKPGIRYRNEGAFSDLYSYRFHQRLQYEDGENFFGTTVADLNRAVGEDATWRWSNRLKYGERTDGVEWRTNLSLRQRFHENTKRPLALSYFGVINGVTRDETYDKELIKNYKLGLLVRRQVYRDFLFVELEPAYHLRRREYDDERDGVWSLVLRLEFALEKDLRRTRSQSSDRAPGDGLE